MKDFFKKLINLLIYGGWFKLYAVHYICEKTKVGVLIVKARDAAAALSKFKEEIKCKNYEVIDIDEI